MIRKLEVRNFKRFANATFEFDDHLVIVGPNNCGKTTLLQAITVWRQVVDRWIGDESLKHARSQSGKYLFAEMGQLDWVPYADLRHLWRNQDVGRSIVISVETKQWKVGFELSYIGSDLMKVRPTADVSESDLDACERSPVSLAYVPPFSGLDIQEREVTPEAVVGVLVRDMVQGRGGSVLRTMLLAISRDDGAWDSLRSVVNEFFGYELSRPSGAAEISVGYRHSEVDRFLEIACGARGFLQVLFVCASLYYRQGAVILVDEPDAHLHMLLQERIYQHLRSFAREQGRQLIVTTHSEVVINAARTDLRFLGAAGLRRVPQERAKHAVGTLGLETSDLVTAETERRILYVEGRTDIDILREWAKVLGHPLLAFLEKPFWSPTAERRKGYVVKHFSALQLAVPDLKAVELRDGNGRDKKASEPRQKVERLYWRRYEIENYLVHREAVLRFVSEQGGKTARQAADLYMKKYHPYLYDTPFDTPPEFRDVKGKIILKGIMEAAGVECAENEYYRIAQQMTKDNVHPEVVKKLDRLAEAIGA